MIREDLSKILKEIKKEAQINETLKELLKVIDGKTIRDLVVDMADKKPDNLAFIFKEEKITYKMLDDITNRIANGLISHGIRKGTKVGLYLGNCLEWVYGYFALQKVGAIPATINTRYTAEELEYALNKADVKALISEELFWQTICKVKDKTKVLSIFMIGEKSFDSTMSFNKLLENGNNALPDVEFNPIEDPAVFLFTGGTTGKPKAVMLSHFGLWYMLVEVSKIEHMDFNTRFQIMTPLWHCAPGHNVMLPLMYAGSCIILEENFSVERCLKRIEEQRATHILGVPAIISILLDSPFFDKYDLSSLKYITYGSAIMPMEVLKKLKTELPDVKLLNGYGQTENSEAYTFLTEEHTWSKPGSIGKAIVGYKFKIVDDDGNEVKVGETGEIVSYGPCIMLGYYNDLKETEKVIRDGWYYTSDLGYVDEDGFLYIVDRKDDRINRAGDHVYPSEVEDVIYKYPGVFEVAVVGVADPIFGQEVKAYITPTPGISLDENKIVEHCKANMPKHKVPKLIEFMDEIPKTAAGKIDKNILRKREG